MGQKHSKSRSTKASCLETSHSKQTVTKTKETLLTAELLTRANNDKLHSKTSEEDPKLHSKTSEEDSKLHSKTSEEDSKLHSKTSEVDSKLHSKTSEEDKILELIVKNKDNSELKKKIVLALGEDVNRVMVSFILPHSF